jgi:hypothetical protein
MQGESEMLGDEVVIISILNYHVGICRERLRVQLKKPQSNVSSTFEILDDLISK